MSKRGLFDFIDAIQANQSSDYYDKLDPEEQKDYSNSRYMINRFLSMEISYLPIINVLQKFNTIPARLHYLCLSIVLPKKKTYNKYIKGVKEKQYEPWLIGLVSKHYNVSQNEAKTYLDIFYKSDKDSLRDLCQKYGIEQKQLKKAKL